MSERRIVRRDEWVEKSGTDEGERNQGGNNDWRQALNMLYQGG